MAVIIKDLFMYEASKVMNLQVFRYSELLMKLNKILADELNQSTSLPDKFFHISF